MKNLLWIFFTIGLAGIMIPNGYTRTLGVLMWTMIGLYLWISFLIADSGDD